jgi:hypothetical protein
VLTMLRGQQGVITAEAIGGQDADSITYIIESESGVDIRKPLFSALAKNNMPLLGLEAMGVSLEDVFLTLVDAKEPVKSKKKTVSKRNSAGV